MEFIVNWLSSTATAWMWIFGGLGDMCFMTAIYMWITYNKENTALVGFAHASTVENARIFYLLAAFVMYLCFTIFLIGFDLGFADLI